MNFNFSSFLNGSLRILNIANKTLPLIKEASPAINNIRQKYISFKQNTPKNPVKELPHTNKVKKIENKTTSNLPTFFN